MMRAKTAVLYHANCYDGFAAAWVAWNKLGEEAMYLPQWYGIGPPGPDALPTTVETVYLLDFCFKREELLGLAKTRDVVVLDHHKTAEAEVAGIERESDRVSTRFDMSRSGATLAWEWFRGGEEPPSLVLYVEDRDLWRFALPKSRLVNAAIRSYPFKFSLWNALAGRDVEDLAREGESVLRYSDRLVETMAEQALLIALAGHQVPAANATALWSEVGDELLRRFPHAPFSASYFDRADGLRQWSLRSRSGFDVSAVARLYGGGGHKEAAGFETEAPTLIVGAIPDVSTVEES